MPTDSPSFTEDDAAAFARLLATDLPTHRRVDEHVGVVVDVEPAPDPGDPEPPEDEGDDGDAPTTYVAVSVLRSDGHHVSATALLQEPLADGQIARAARACTAGVLAQLADYDADAAG